MDREGECAVSRQGQASAAAFENISVVKVSESCPQKTLTNEEEKTGTRRWASVSQMGEHSGKVCTPSGLQAMDMQAGGQHEQLTFAYRRCSGWGISLRSSKDETLKKKFH